MGAVSRRDCCSDQVLLHWSSMGCLRFLSILSLASVPLRAFEISSMDPGSGTVAIQEGQNFDLWCNADNWWEWCTFTHVTTRKICDLQWKWEPRNVTANDCDGFEYLGDYRTYKCGVRIYNAGLGDAGEWTCDLREYDRAETRRDYGNTVSRSFQVEVEATTTTSTTTTAPPPPPLPPHLTADEDDGVGETGNGFSITSSGSVNFTAGWPLELWCNVDDWWEWCTFIHLSSNKFCDFQWKSGPDNVTVNQCDFEGRYKYTGDYDNYKCGIRIYNTRIEDSGEWRCDLEQYSRAETVRGHGAKVRKTFQVWVTDWHVVNLPSQQATEWDVVTLPPE